MTGLGRGVLLSEGVGSKFSTIEFSREMIQLLKLFVGVTEHLPADAPSTDVPSADTSMDREGEVDIESATPTPMKLVGPSALLLVALTSPSA